MSLATESIKVRKIIQMIRLLKQFKTVHELSDELQMKSHTVKRDIKELIKLNIVIQYNREYICSPGINL